MRCNRLISISNLEGSRKPRSCRSCTNDILQLTICYFNNVFWKLAMFKQLFFGTFLQFWGLLSSPVWLDTNNYVNLYLLFVIQRRDGSWQGNNWRVGSDSILMFKKTKIAFLPIICSAFVYIHAMWIATVASQRDEKFRKVQVRRINRCTHLPPPFAL